MRNNQFIALFIIIFLALEMQGQSSSDCVGALPFCTSTGEGEPTVSPGDGDVSNETALACVDNEGYSTWYTFTATTDGIFNFILTPVNEDDDYDWALFNITGSSCEDIPNDANLIVSCNSWGDFGVNGPTGISTALGGEGNQNGPGTTNGPPFNEDLQVLAGETYVLMVSNWSESTEGFNIDVSGSTAGGVYADGYINTLPNQEICEGSPLNLSVNFSGNPLSDTIIYYWQPPQLFEDPFVPDPIFNSGINSTQNIRVTIVNGPCRYSRDATIYVATMEYTKEQIEQNICVGERLKLDVNFTGNVVPSGLTYSWEPKTLLNNPAYPTPTTTQITENTTFYFEIENGPCIINDSLEVIVYYDTVKADFDYSINDDSETVPIEVDFTKLSAGDSTWEWFFGDNTSSTEENPFQHPYPGYDTYEVELVAKSASTFCVDTARKTIVFPDVEIPNIITPNNDGINDVFWITGLKIGTGLRIYNRWGKLLFEEDDYMHNWRGEGLSDGLYYIEFYDDNEATKKAWLQLLR